MFFAAETKDRDEYVTFCEELGQIFYRLYQGNPLLIGVDGGTCGSQKRILNITTENRFLCQGLKFMPNVRGPL